MPTVPTDIRERLDKTHRRPESKNDYVSIFEASAIDSFGLPTVFSSF